jgi:hypothetical protein
MAYSTASVLSNHRDIASAVEAKLSELTISTLHAVKLIRLAPDQLLALIVYE